MSKQIIAHREEDACFPSYNLATNNMGENDEGGECNYDIL
jgi:hypothetical protein